MLKIFQKSYQLFSLFYNDLVIITVNLLIVNKIQRQFEENEWTVIMLYIMVVKAIVKSNLNIFVLQNVPADSSLILR